MAAQSEYPFINPIIVSKDGKIIDGQYRFQVCKEENYEVRHIQIKFNSDQLQDKEAIEEIREIQRKQKIKLEYFFKNNNIDFKTQLQLCSSVDKMEKFFQYEAFLLSDEEYWNTLSDCYRHSNNNMKFSQKIKKAFNSDRSNREILMNETEREELHNLPDRVTIYRGMSIVEEEKGDYGISWTLNESVARKFADDYIHNYDTRHLHHIVKQLTINKNDIIALFLDGQESEIIYINE